MSLDFSLYENGDEVFTANITHNLNKMAEAAGIYGVLWRPDENGATHARHIIKVLREGLLELIEHKEKYEKLNAPNGWGLYEHFVPFVAEVLTACYQYPNAQIVVSR